MSLTYVFIEWVTHNSIFFFFEFLAFGKLYANSHFISVIFELKWLQIQGDPKLKLIFGSDRTPYIAKNDFLGTN